MGYFLRRNIRSRRTTIHRENCRYVLSRGVGVSEWLGPFGTVEEARARAEGFPVGPSLCEVCGVSG